MNTCLQIGFSACGEGTDLVSGLSVSHRSVPLVTGANGTLMARDLCGNGSPLHQRASG
jgi:hypothetical protein